MSEFNSSDRNVNRAIRSWLHEDRHEDASRLAGAILDRVETIPQRRATWWPVRRTPTMTRFVTFGLGAAAVVVVALLLGSRLIGSLNDPGGPDDQASPTPTIKPTPHSTPSLSAAAGLSAGPFTLVDWAAGDPADLPPLNITIPGPGWDGEEKGGILFWHGGAPDDGMGMIVFAQTEYRVFGDPCHWATTVPDKPVTSVDQFVAALAAQPSRHASEPVDITIDGYSGKSITLHGTENADFRQCDQGQFGTWDCGEHGAAVPCEFNDSGETSVEYIFDVDGTLVAWHTDYRAGTPPDAVAAMERLVLSARFGD